MYKKYYNAYKRIQAVETSTTFMQIICITKRNRHFSIRILNELGELYNRNFIKIIKKQTNYFKQIVSFLFPGTHIGI